MPVEEVRSDGAPKALGTYSQAVVANGFLYTAGVGPQDPASGEIIGTTIEEQTAQVMRNLRSLLAGRGLTFAEVVKTTVHLEDLRRDFSGFDATYGSFLEAPYPVRTTVGSALSGVRVEIDMIAACERE